MSLNTPILHTCALDSIIIGQHCSTSVPSWTGPTAIGVAEPSFGVVMSSFNALRSKMDGTTEWHLSKITYLPTQYQRVGRLSM